MSRQQTMMDDSAFLTSVGVTQDAGNAALILTIRCIIAKWCHLDPRVIQPQVENSTYHEMMRVGWAFGWDEMWFVHQLEQALNVCFLVPMEDMIPPFVGGRFFWFKMTAPRTFGEWVVLAASQINSVLLGNHNHPGTMAP